MTSSFDMDSAVNGEAVAKEQAKPPSPSLSFAKRKQDMAQRSTTATPEQHKILPREIGRPMMPVSGNGIKQPRKTPSNNAMSKSRSMYFEGAFQAGREVSPAKDRARSEAMVMADVRTNVIIRDEFSFITDLSYQLSIRYQRPVSSVVVTLQHGACMLFGGTFDPAYVMSVSALPSDVAPTKNKRNAALMQKHMEESLGVASSRGLLRFVAVPEENTARSGKTVAGEIADSGKKEDADGITSKEKSRRRLSVKASLDSLPPYRRMTPDMMQSLSSLRPAPSNSEPAAAAMDALPPRAPMTRVVEEDESPAAVGDAPNPAAEAPAVPTTSKHVNRRKSFVASVFRRSSRTHHA